MNSIEIRNGPAAFVLSLLLCMSVNATAAPAEAGSATLAIRDVILQPFSLTGHPMVPAVPVPLLQGQRASSIVSDDWFEPMTASSERSGAPVALSHQIPLGSGEGSNLMVADRFTATLDSRVSSISGPWTAAQSNYSYFMDFMLEPNTALTISGRIFGDVMRSTASALGTAPSSHAIFSLTFFGYAPPDIPRWEFSATEQHGESVFDETFSLTAYNRTADPLLISLQMNANVLASAHPGVPIPEPHAAYMLAAGLVLLLVLRRRVRGHTRRMSDVCARSHPIDANGCR